MMLPPDLLEDEARRCLAVCHAGAHVGQERFQYDDWGITDVLWVEANGALIDELTANVAPFGHRVAHACLGSTSGQEVTFHIADEANGKNHGQSSSVLDLGTHKVKHPEVFFTDHVTMTTSTLDEVMAEYAPDWLERGDLLTVSDLQGSDVDVMRGAPNTLAQSRMTMHEVNIEPLYVDCGLFPELDALLVASGFEVQDVVLAGCQRRDCSDGGSPQFVGWGDCWSLRTENPRPFAQNFPSQYEGWYVPERGRAAQRRDRARARRR